MPRPATPSDLAATAAAARTALAERYDALWDAAAPLVRAGHAALDPHAARPADDPRRGVTLLARPDAATAGALAGFVDELRALEPAQYYQPTDALHLTVLGLFTATADYAPCLAHLDAYRDVAAEAAAGEGPLTVDLVGVTLAPGAVLAQGFPRGGALERVRARLRAALARRGLGGTADTRYRLETAHVTLARLTRPLAHPAGFVDALAAARGRELGALGAAELELALGDWHQTPARSRVLARVPLGGRAA